MSASEAVLAWDARMELGEGPVWDERAQVLYVVDILRGSIVRFDPAHGTHETVARLDVPVGAIALRPDGGLIAAAGTTVALLDEEATVQVVAATPDTADVRFNDGVCDPQGRFWAGTMALDEAPGAGTLYRYDARGLVPMVPQVTVSNGIDWSGDGTLMYYADSPTGRIEVFAFDGTDGSLSDRRTFVDLGTETAVPDGLCVDAEDHVWVALWNGWAVHRYRPDGVLDRVVELPVARPTSCAFGGGNLGDLFITSASIGLSAAELEAQPWAGGVLALRPGVHGRLPNRFAG